ncbi:MAG: hypothetical protein IKB52_01230 [Kiritimatiellae bacterium]|nr:hypothetical protein [Kiritimatiellia bacterium]MBR2487727.1 hypothetical protein [Kiritimatiellia bacterium]
MSLRLASVLRDFKDQGITAADMTADELEVLVHAVERVNNPYSDINADLCERPVKVCRGVYLWPLTAGAYMWLEEYAGRWWGKKSAMYRWAQTYALANGRDPEAFAKLTDKWTARRAIVKTMLRFTCHRAELTVAKNLCYGVRQHDVEDPRPAAAPDEQATDFAHLAAMLEVESGISAKSWLFGKSLATMVKTYRRMKSLKNAFGGADGAEKMTFELNDALANLARVKSMIFERVTAERSQAEDPAADLVKRDVADEVDENPDAHGEAPPAPLFGGVSGDGTVPVPSADGESRASEEEVAGAVAGAVAGGVVHDGAYDTKSGAGGQP